jgi:excisionase family DNA binding protein
VRERKQLIRAVIAEIGLTVHRQRRVAELRIIWQGGAVTGVAMPMTKPGRHLRVTNEDTIALVRRLAQHYDDRTIAAILAKQKRRTATGLPFTRARVAILRANHAIPIYQPPAQPDVRPLNEDVVVVTITEAEKMLGVSRETLYRWIRDGFITAEQITPGAPWRIRIDQALRNRIQPEAPEGWLGLDDAAKALGVARQTVLHKVQRGQLQAVHVNRGRRKGLRIQVKPDQTGLFDTIDRRNAQC